MDMAEIEELTRYADERINAAKERLAYEVTKLVHGEEKATAAMQQARAAFGGNAEDMPKVTIGNDCTTVIDLLVAAGLCKSKGEARRLIQEGGVKIGEEKITDIAAGLPEGEFVLHKGKKVHILVERA
jgi:tyrosyl-tRNA synthetase